MGNGDRKEGCFRGGRRASSEAKILRCAQDDREGPFCDEEMSSSFEPCLNKLIRVSLSLLLADKSGLEMHYYLSPRQGPTSPLCVACGSCKEDASLVASERKLRMTGWGSRMTVGFVPFVAVGDHLGHKDPSLRSG